MEFCGRDSKRPRIHVVDFRRKELPPAVVRTDFRELIYELFHNIYVIHARFILYSAMIRTRADCDLMNDAISSIASLCTFSSVTNDANTQPISRWHGIYSLTQDWINIRVHFVREIG